MKIAIIGGGVSGLVTAHLLSDGHEITLFEANDYLGGHTHTVDVPRGEKSWAVDTGFIVFIVRTYPNFIKLLERLGVASQLSDMSFSVMDKRNKLEYRASSLNTLFAQRSNLFNIPFWQMLQEIFRFRKETAPLYGLRDMHQSLGDFLQTHGYSRMFIEQFIVPMGSAIWSADPKQFLQFPINAFVTFFTNHGILSVVDQPKWRVVRGGSREYVAPLCAPFRDRVRLSTPVDCVRRLETSVEVTPRGGTPEVFDQVVLACHSDQALAMLADPTPAEKELLGAIPYQKNNTVLHTDSQLLPSRPLARASWNCLLSEKEQEGVCLTYWMNKLQSLETPETFCVTLNSPEAVRSEAVIQRFVYHHPVYSTAAFEAQERCGEISGVNRTWYCGAYWGYGFHEDGVKSALAVCKHFGKEL
jgi:predicted NAD/FAD-binding protein